ncbi:transporter [Stenotrophomonas sepilia]|uniref:transporter n=1 Tax=Stenotrophomonas sepilia TaxID=2860290 RepID=UPI001FECD6D7|nr:transporter [Stenotrophomonas sepilia]
MPVDTNLLFVYYTYARNEIAFDPSLPVDGARIESQLGIIRYARTFALGDRIAGIQVLAPYGKVTGSIGGTPLRTSASGMGDATGIFLVNVFGAPALTPWEAGAYLTASVGVTAPTGSYDRDSILNLGKNRWSYKPQLAYGLPLAEGTLLAINGNVQFYGDAERPGEAALEQKPLYGLDLHLSTNVGERVWLSMDANYAHGGRSGSGGVWKDNGQRTLKMGVSGNYAFSPRVGLSVSANRTVLRRDVTPAATTVSVNCSFVF